MKKLSYPKNKIKVLLLEKIDKVALSLFKKEGYNVECYDGSLNERELIKRIKTFQYLVYGLKLLYLIKL